MTTEFKTWETIKLGTGFTSDNAIDKAIRLQGKKLSNRARFMMNGYPFRINQPMELDLVLVDVVKDFGLTRDASKQDVCDRAITLGLWLCPTEAGPQLHLQASNQSDQPIIIASEVLAPTNKPSLFMLSVGGYDLDSYEIDSPMPTILWVFVLPHK